MSTLRQALYLSGHWWARLLLPAANQTPGALAPLLRGATNQQN
ncbi:hypothetical protein AVDCRST_MAG94-4212 [uncultured Leptolyngbya sp.]|uniref:Uncharacterized protein n=1 Tax=uncultured Leptolyngbya sp. TaxID=332963 RepID=A0A6J4MXQ5_9CYAN|nr:hypothetical protein AVDCRST_MAG94-4212 [uncultured Leptolyngbya sp.]